MVPGLILAAGASTRMGRPKALLPCGETGLTFVSSLILALRDGGAADVLVVGRPDDHPLRMEVETRGGRFVENPRPAEGQLSSLLVGLNVADRPGVRGLLVTPVDVPLVTGAVVATLIREFHAADTSIVRAVHRGRHGHPVIFSRTVFDELRRADPAVGAKAVLHAHASAVKNVEVGSDVVLTDVDTPQDYEGIFGKIR